MNVLTEESRDAAASWVARMDADEWSADDEAALARWLDEDSAYSGLLLRTQAAWIAGDQIGNGWPVATAEPSDHAENTAWPRRAFLAGLAATVVATIGRFALQAPMTAYATERGEIRRVPLSDGSVMTINSASVLDVRLEAKRRQVDLTQGEAWFEVAKDVRRPFVVAAGRIQVQAVGTAFSVRIRGEAVEILVTEGVVEAWTTEDATARMRLTAGQIASIAGHADVRRVADESSSVDRALAWRSGMIDLQGKTLADAAEEFNRYNERQLVVAEGPIAHEQFDGVFRINDPEGFALAVRDSLNVPVEMANSTTIHIGVQKKRKDS